MMFVRRRWTGSPRYRNAAADERANAAEVTRTSKHDQDQAGSDEPVSVPQGAYYVWRLVKVPLRRRSISYPAMFVLGFLCSLLFGWFQPERLPEPVRERARVASAAVARAFDEVFHSDTIEGVLSTTSKLRDILDAQAATVSGRFTHATSRIREALPNRPLGISEVLGTWQVPTITQVLGRSERVGVRMARKGAAVRSPVVMVPGIITTGLEVWDGEECIKTYFRQRIWGTVTMFQSIFSDPDCWVRHLALNATTGLDPLQRPGFNRTIRVRPSQGFESADFFLGGYWLWGLMIEALADIGYDLNSMYMASYDWRLSFADLERRDRYFTRLRQQIETLVSMNEQKAVVIAHSMGGNVWHYFMQWVTHRIDRNWVNEHIASEILISSPLLGLPKAYYSLLTGDNRDFATMGSFSAVVNHFFGPSTRRSLWRTCSSLAMIMPIGGEIVWGAKVLGRPLVHVGARNLTVEDAYDLLAMGGSVPEDLQRISPWLLQGLRLARPQSRHESAHGQARTEALPEHIWGNALAAPLPFAPNLRMYAFYGVGVPTEFSGVLEETRNLESKTEYIIDKDATQDAGFFLGDGDYSCPVLSLGAMCLKGWREPERNPAHIPCVVKEYRDRPTTLLSGGTIRGGPSSGDHIDILGNDELLSDVLNIVSGGHVDARILSDIEATVARWHDA
mmetsp:Transcript_64682/g.179953  ORF Transcript_64682/g.179953 Transcript_64682/m.179953 type:complete len:677 (-) Transcript_64682:41-2071(-)